MQRCCALGGVVLLFGCAAGPAPGAAEATEPRQAPTTLAIPPPSADTEPDNDEQAYTRDSAGRQGDLVTCVAALREGDGLDLSGETPDAQALYDDALRHERAGRVMEARNAYYDLIRKHPKSRNVPLAYVAFGELFFDEAKADPSRYPLATAAYQEGCRYPPPVNTVYQLARLRLGEINLATGSYTEALGEQKKAIEYARRYADDRCAAPLAEAARADLIRTYAKAGRPERAYGFFKSLTNPGDLPQLSAMMVDLAEQYRKNGDYEEAAICLLAALNNGPSRATCDAAAAMVDQGSQSPATGKLRRLEALWMKLCERP